MTNVAKLATEDRSEARRRLHLRDITNELPTADETAGSDLRAARERRGEDLRSIAQSLRIRREQLEAIEESRYEDLPGRAYAVGFVRSYAEYLGLDSAHIVQRYKAEIDQSEKTRTDLVFPKLSEETRLPRGTFLIIGLIVAAGIYGGYLLTRSADRMMAERVPPVPARIEARVAGADAPDERPVGLSGDPASAATRPTGNATPAQVLGAGAPADPASVYAVAPSQTPPAVTGTTEIAALTPQTGDTMNAVAPEAPAAAIPGLPPIAQGQVYGAENADGRVVIRARKDDAWIRVEDAQGHVLIERTLKAGDTYRSPNRAGVILVARDASAFELLVDNASLGLAGPPTLVLTGKSLDAADLIAAMPRPAPAPADEAAAVAPAARPQVAAPATTPSAVR
ncbi:MAG TPA: RodZ domain-containing protein [Parvibaculum sp.]